MATITGFTSARMLAIEQNSIVSGAIVGNDLILTRQAGTTLNAGNVRGATGAPGATVGELAASSPIGMIVDFIGTTPPTNYLAMTGQTIASGQTTYATLWALLPASMKSGSSIIMPDTRGRVSVGYNSLDADFDTIGEIGGAKTHALSVAELAVHTHVQDIHNHTQIAHAHSGVTEVANTDHTHLVNLNTAYSGAHFHIVSPDPTLGVLYQKVATGIGGNATIGPSGPTSGADTAFSIPIGGGSDGNHQHNVSGSTQGHSVNHAHTFSTSNATATNIGAAATNQNAGSGTAHNNVQPYVVFMKVIKAL